MVPGASAACRVLNTRTPSQRRADTDLCRLIVADLADHAMMSGSGRSIACQPFAEGFASPRFTDLSLTDTGQRGARSGSSIVITFFRGELIRSRKL